MLSNTDFYIPSGIERLETAMRSVLKEAFDEVISSLAESQSWFSPDMDISEVFLLWASDQLLIQTDPHWVFQPLRASERKFLVEAVGLDRNELIGKPVERVVESILISVGLPGGRIFGSQQVLEMWESFEHRISIGDDQGVASLARQQSERILRILLIFYGGVLFASHFRDILDNPGNLRVPSILQRTLENSDPESKLYDALLVDGWADLGFLLIAIRKLSAKLEEDGIRLLNTNPLVIMSSADQKAFDELAKALQAYTHDRPSAHEVRESDLLVSIRAVTRVLKEMSAKGILPDQGVVIETCNTIFGSSVVIQSGKTCRRFLTSKQPELGTRIYYVSSSKRQWAKCAWVASPWATS